jgi:hypothetical protein
MAPYREKPTWAILPSSKPLPGSKSLELLGCVVADIENPTDHYVPRDPLVFQKQLPKALEVEDIDTKTVLSSTHASHVDIRLTKIFGFDVGQQSGQQRNTDAQTVITRFLTDHPRVFRMLVDNDEYHRDILEMMDWNPINKKTAYMVVGVKSCLDANISEIRQFESHLGGGAELPLNAALVASGIVLLVLRRWTPLPIPNGPTQGIYSPLIQRLESASLRYNTGKSNGTEIG